MVKSGGAQRESDGVVVPVIAAGNAVRGKGPTSVTQAEWVSAGAWPGLPGPTTLAGNLGPSCCTGVHR